MNRKITLTGANIVFLIFTAAFFIYQIMFAILLGNKFVTENIYFMLLINEFILILVPVLIYAYIKKLNFRETFRLNKPGWIPSITIILISVPVYFVAAMINNIVVYLLQFIGKIPNQSIPIPKTIPELLIGLLVIAVVPGICEETLHRGLLLRAYEKRGTYKALVIISIYFGLFHFDITNLLGPIFSGLIIGYYVIRTNSIFAGMLAHFLNNAIAEFIQFFWSEKTQPEYTAVTSQDILQLVLYGIAGLIIASILMIFFKKVTAGKYIVTPPISSVKRDITSVMSHWPVIIILILYFLTMILYIVTIVVLKIMG